MQGKDAGKDPARLGKQTEGLRERGMADDVAPLSTEAIFRQLIENEIRDGRLTRARRRRIVRYAAQLRLSAIDAGRMIEACRAELDDSPGKPMAAPLTYVPVEADPRGPTAVWKAWLIVVLAILFDLMMVKWFTS